MAKKTQIGQGIVKNNIKARRIDKEMTLLELESKTGIWQDKLSIFERGFRIPNDKDKFKIAKALDAEVGELFPPRKGEPEF